MLSFFSLTKQNWLAALRNASFRNKLIPACIIVATILCAMPFFFPAIEKRNGTLLHDWVLEHLPSYNLSVAIFIIIWSTGLLAIIRAMTESVYFSCFCMVVYFCNSYAGSYNYFYSVKSAYRFRAVDRSFEQYILRQHNNN